MAGSIDQVLEEATLTWVQPRVLSLDQVPTLFFVTARYYVVSRLILTLEHMCTVRVTVVGLCVYLYNYSCTTGWLPINDTSDYRL